MKINYNTFTIKLHFFLFMASMGPILPQIPIFGKNLGISPSIMGTITGLLPFTFLLAKVALGYIFDICSNWRKLLFIVLIASSTFFYILMYPILPNIEPTDATNATQNVFDDIGNAEILTNFYSSFTFWGFVVLLSLGTIGYNVVNSISDVVCFNIVEQYEEDYGKQRLWGSVGFGLSALISGILVQTLHSTSKYEYIGLFGTMLFFAIFDIIISCKLEIPIIPAPKNLVKDLLLILKNFENVVFLVFSFIVGAIDALPIYFLFWHLEDLAAVVHTPNIKLIEGFVVAAETLGGEILFFYVAQKLLTKLGHVYCFSFCFFNYFLRLGMIGLAQFPYAILVIEFFMQGPTYALTYSTIVSYANELAPAGTSGTMQGLAAGLCDGAGYAIGSVIGGLLYEKFGGATTFKIFAGVALLSSVLHLALNKIIYRAPRGYIRIA